MSPSRFTLLGRLQRLVLFSRQVLFNGRAHQCSQAIRRNSVKFYRTLAAKAGGARIAALGRPAGQPPFAYLCWRDGELHKVDLGIGRELAELLLNVPRRILAAGVRLA